MVEALAGEDNGGSWGVCKEFRHDEACNPLGREGNGAMKRQTIGENIVGEKKILQTVREE